MFDITFFAVKINIIQILKHCFSNFNYLSFYLVNVYMNVYMKV